MLKTTGSIERKCRRIALGFAAALVCVCGMCSAAFADDETQNGPTEELKAENGIPLVIVRVDETTRTIDQMNASADHSARCEDATVEIKLPEEGYQAPEGYKANVPEGEKTLKYVRGRGNSTWACSKKPYKLELKEAVDLFGMGASTDWALLANSFDSSLMRNRISFWLGEKMSLDYTPQQVPVDLVMVGNQTGEHWYGSYCLCETIKIEESRINIGKLKKKDTENITGGYVLATYSDQDGGEDPSTWFTTNYGVEFYNDSPDYIVEPDKPLSESQLAQRDYIRGYMQEVEDLIMKAEMEDGKITAAAHQKIDEKMDLTSAADFWLLQEIPYNTDGYATTSTYLYKARDGKLYWGPLWDCDYAWWNNSMEWDKMAESKSLNNTRMLWIDYLRENDPAFAKLLKERWQVMKGLLQDLTKENGIIDQYKAEVSKSQQADYELWKDRTGDYKGTSAEDYNAEIEKMRTWIDNRAAWTENNKSELDHVYCTAIYMVKGKVVATESVRYGDKPVLDPDAPVPEGYVLKAWMKGSKEAAKTEMTEDTIFNAVFAEEGEAVAPEAINIAIPELPYISVSEGTATIDISEGFFPAIDREGITLDMFAEVEPYGQVTNPRITWTSSNEKVGTIDPVRHRVILKAGGDTTITGTLYNGVTGSFVLHVNGPEPEPEPEPAPQPVSIQGAKVVLSATAYTYNGKIRKPAVKTIGGKTLKAGTDYTVSIANSKGTTVKSPKTAGKYTVKVTGIGGYTGKASATYTIKKAANTLKVSGKTVKVKRKAVKKKTQVLGVTRVIKFTNKGQGAKTYVKSSGNKKITIAKKTGKITVKKGLKKGTYKVKVKVTAAGTANYKKSAVKIVTITVKVK